ncbi:MAG: hypothetical protein Q7S79_02825 [bacterium]|nr:hypothetical protein [bacterium]
MTKRQKFVLTSLVLAFGFFLVQFVDFDFRYPAIAGLTLSSLGLCYWALKEGLKRGATLLTLILPTFFTAGVGLFYFLLQTTGVVAILTRIPVLIIYALGIYALLLTSNIYTVATVRTIQLLRAAHAVGFLLTLVSAFLLFDTIFSLRLDFWINSIGMGLISYPLFLQGFWAIELEGNISPEIKYISAGLALVLGQIGAVLSFWPITVPVASLALTTVVYVGLGLGQAKLQQRLFSKTIKEYFFVVMAVFITMFLTAKWGG